MKNKELATVPFYAYESAIHNAEKTQRRILAALTASMAVNIAFIMAMARKGF